MLLVLALTALSLQGTHKNATSSAVTAVGMDVGKSDPATGDSARRQLASGVTFHVFSTYEGSTHWSVWLGHGGQGRCISCAGSTLMYGDGWTSTNQATFEDSYYSIKGEPSGDPLCDGGEVFEAVSWASAQDLNHFGVILEDREDDDGSLMGYDAF